MRKRMIVPEFWESATDKNWSVEDALIMIAAISAADDEGRGRISTIRKNVSFSISDRKFNKSIKNLSENSNSLTVFQKIYYFLPNFLKYQTVSHPQKSRIPSPEIEFQNTNSQGNNNLVENNDGIIPENFQNDSGIIPSQVSLNKFSLVKCSGSLKENDHDYDTTFEDFKEEKIHGTITQLGFKLIWNSEPNKAQADKIKLLLNDDRFTYDEMTTILKESFTEIYESNDPEKQKVVYFLTKLERKRNDFYQKKLRNEKKKLENDRDLKLQEEHNRSKLNPESEEETDLDDAVGPMGKILRDAGFIPNSKQTTEKYYNPSTRAGTTEYENSKKEFISELNGNFQK